MMAENYDVMVIGAGAIGSAAAYHAARAGARVLLLEQYAIDHQRGSSYGYSRIIRYAYDHLAYMPLLRAAYPMWAELEAEAGETLYLRSGGLDFAPPGTPSFDAVIGTLRATGIEHEVLTAREAMHRYPQFQLPEHYVAMVQAEAGVLRASRCVLAHVEGARRRGAVVRDYTTVERITPNADGVEVIAGGETFRAARLIVAGGAWMEPLLQPFGIDLHLRPVAAQENYYANEELDRYGSESFPCFIAHLRDEFPFMPYGLPSVDGSGVKIGMHGGWAIDPASPDRTPDERTINFTNAFAAKYMPGAAARHVMSRVCIYTMTPDEHFVIDTLPDAPHVVIASSCSGHAFKFSTLIGRILSDLAVNGATAHEIGLFRMARLLETA